MIRSHDSHEVGKSLLVPEHRDLVRLPQTTRTSSDLTARGLIFRDFQHIQILAAESGDLYMISASYRQPPIASATAALGATPRTRLRAEPAR